MNFQEAIEAIWTRTPQGMAEGLAAILALIEQGAAVNLPLDNGMTPLAFLVSRSRDDARHGVAMSQRNNLYEATSRSVKALIEAGADPWLGEPCLWEREHHELWQPSVLLDYFSAREASNESLLGPNGETHLHAILKRNDHILASYLETAFQESVRPEWVNAADHDGNTPLHVLWSPAYEPFEIDEALNITRMLIEVGARLDQDNLHGRCPADLIVSKIEWVKDLCEIDSVDDTHWVETICKAQAQAEANRIDQDTPGASRRKTLSRM